MSGEILTRQCTTCTNLGCHCPENRQLNYKLRTCSQQMTLTINNVLLAEQDFIIRMLYTNAASCFTHCYIRRLICTCLYAYIHI